MDKGEKKKGTLAWVLEFAGINKSAYIISVFMAIISVIAGFVPYWYVAKIVRALIEGNKDLSFYLTQCGYITICWLINKIFHTISTTMSHKATFGVLAEIRRS